MTDQISMFEETSESNLSQKPKPTLSEKVFFLNLKNYLFPVFKINHANQDSLVLEPHKNFCSILFSGILLSRIRLRSKSSYISIRDLKTSNQLGKKRRNDKFTKISIDDILSAELTFSSFSDLLEKVINEFPKEFDCCHLYEECSNERACINGNLDYSMGCGYKKILKQGTVFFGKNRNIN